MKGTAVVTGGSRGIGRAIVKRLLAAGWSVAAVGTRPDGALTQEEIDKAAGGQREGAGEETVYRYIRADISCGADRRRILKEALAGGERIDLLVNNAGTAPAVRADLLEMTEESFDRVMGINLKGTLFLTQLAARHMIGQEPADGRKGMIIQIGSVSADTVSENRGEYCISKAGIGMLTQLYAARLAPEGIPVYEIRPGIIATDMTAGVREKYDQRIRQGICPIARWGKPEDVAEAVALLCEGRLPYTTGQVLYVDGGLHMRRL